MEFFNYADWRAEGRRMAFAKGSPDIDTEQLKLLIQDDEVLVVYTVSLKTTEFETVIKSYTGEQFSVRFMSMLEVEEPV